MACSFCNVLLKSVFGSEILCCRNFNYFFSSKCHFLLRQ